MKIRKSKHVLGRRPAQAPSGMADRWLIAGTLVRDPYPRYIPRRGAPGITTPEPEPVAEAYDDGQLDLDWGDGEDS